MDRDLDFWCWSPEDDLALADSALADNNHHSTTDYLIFPTAPTEEPLFFQPFRIIENYPLDDEPLINTFFLLA